MQMADSFMDLPAWGFWGVIVAIVAIPIGVWAARAGERQARLYYELSGTAQLLSQPGAADDQLAVSWNGIDIDDPHVTTLHLAVRSRRDIREDAFARGESLTFNLGVPILKILQRDYEPADGRCPEIDGPQISAVMGKIVHRPDQGEIRIGPDLIHRDARLRLTLLTDGTPDVAPPERTLVDVDLRPGTPPTPAGIYRVVTGIAALSGLLGGGIYQQTTHASTMPTWLSWSTVAAIGLYFLGDSKTFKRAIELAASHLRA